ncbi:MAG TPA: hypothetical protein VNU97_09645 [Rhizomicrobium sp.]|jgi:hypothetical protein|nr:hypothetical protein [Rhizomicrobium sp.]
MRIRTGLLAVGFAALLGGCTDLDMDLFGDSSEPAAAPNGCTATGCPQAAQFCVARGYAAGTDGYNRCLVSVEENLRKGQ